MTTGFEMPSLIFSEPVVDGTTKNVNDCDKVKGESELIVASTPVAVTVKSRGIALSIVFTTRRLFVRHNESRMTA